jgi:hypothetical protein
MHYNLFFKIKLHTDSQKPDTLSTTQIDKKEKRQTDREADKETKDFAKQPCTLNQVR